MKYIESIQNNINKVAKEITDCQGYVGEEANIYESGVASGYERALMDNSKAIDMHDKIISMLQRNHTTLLSVYSNVNFGNDSLVKQQILRDEMRDILELIKQAEQK